MTNDTYDGYTIENGFHVIDASPLGSITVEVRDGMLYLESVDIDGMWMLHKQELKSDEIELGFYKGDSELKIKVELDEGQLKKMVEIDMDYDDDTYDGYTIENGFHVIDASPLGSITVEVRDGMLYLESVDIDGMWMLHKQELKSDEIELGFYKGDSELKIKVELDEGQLKKMVEIDMDYDDDTYDGYTIENGFHVIDASPLGSITVEVRDGMLYLESVDIDGMWMLHKQELKSDEIELGFYKGDSELKIKVELDEGQLKKMVEIDMDN